MTRPERERERESFTNAQTSINIQTKNKGYGFGQQGMFSIAFNWIPTYLDVVRISDGIEYYILALVL